MAKKSEKTPAAQTQKSGIPATAEAAYEAFLAEAMALDEDEIAPFRYEPALAIHNARSGLDAVTTELDALRAYGLPVEKILDFSAILLAFSHAVARAEAEAGSDKTLAKKLARNSEIRTLLLAVLQLATVSKMIDGSYLAHIKKGRGMRDSAQDVADLANVLERPEVHGKFTQVTPELLAEGKLLSAELLTLLTPIAAKKKTKLTASHATAVEIRNRFAALVLDRHDWLWRCGALLFGRDVDRRVPGLSANRAPAQPLSTGSSVPLAAGSVRPSEPTPQPA